MPLLCGFTLTIVKKMAAQEEGCWVQAKPLRAGGCDCHAVFLYSLT
jgi:hypothetical protein